MTPGIQPPPNPIPFPPIQLGPLDAINELFALPWSGYIPPFVAAHIDAIVSSLEGKVLAQDSHYIDSNTGWDFALTLKDVSVNIDLANPPGFSNILPLGKDGGFTFEAPLKGVYTFGFKGNLELSSKIVAGGVNLWNAGLSVFQWSLILSIKLQATVETREPTPNWPVFKRLTVTPTLGLEGSAPIPFAVGGGFQVTVQPGLIQFKETLADVSVGLGNSIDAGLAVKFVVDLIPSSTFDFLGTKIPTAVLTCALDGDLTFSLPDVGQTFNTSGLSTKLTLATETLVPIPEFLNQFFILDLDQQYPIQVGLNNQGLPNPGGEVHAPPPNYDFGTPACEIEKAAIATHLPYDAVLAIEHERGPYLPMWSAFHYYSDEEDSAIWTGHFLAAASFQYAATNDAAALQLVNQLLDGVDKLFTVCTDAVVKNSNRSAVPVTVSAAGVRTSGFFARSVLPDDSRHRWWQADDSIENDNRAFYEWPEGGWEIFVDGKTTLQFPTYAKLQEYLDHTPIPNGAKPLSKTAIRPVGRVWCGTGAGGTFFDASTDHQLSRDQIIGICFGLFTAWSLAPSVQSRAAARLNELIGYIYDNEWNVRLPPDMSAVCTSYLGGFDHQLALLRIAATVNPAEYGAKYDYVKAASEYMWIAMWISILDPLSQYYKMNLSHAAIVPILLAEQDLTLRKNYLLGYDILRQSTGHHRNAWFNVANILIQLPADRAAYIATAKAGSNPALPLSAEILGILVEWLERRKKVAEPDCLPTNHVPDAEYIVNLWNQHPDKVELYPAPEGSAFYISNFARRVDHRVGGIMEFTWQNHPFDLGLAGKPNGPLTLKEALNSDEPFRELSGVDYLLPFWIAVYLGILQAPMPPNPTGPQPQRP
jgi:hypothetical protein